MTSGNSNMSRCSRGCCSGPTPEKAQAEHYRSITLATAVLVVGNKKDHTLSKDLESYKRLRSHKLQPRQIDGCAALEAKANTREQVEGTSAIPKGGW